MRFMAEREMEWDGHRSVWAAQEIPERSPLMQARYLRQALEGRGGGKN